MEVHTRSVWERSKLLALRAHLQVLLGVVEHLGSIVALVDGFVSEGPACLPRGSHNHHHESPTSSSWLRLVRDTLNKGQSGTWSRIFCTRCYLEEYTWLPSAGVFALQLCRRATPHPSDRRWWSFSVTSRFSKYGVQARIMDSKYPRRVKSLSWYLKLSITSMIAHIFAYNNQAQK